MTSSSNKTFRLRNIVGVLILLIVILAVFAPPSSADAQLEDYTVLAPLPGTTIGECPGPDCKTNFSTYLPGLFNFAIGFAGVLAFIMITYGGIQYMTSDSIGRTEKGREKIENAVWGLIIVIGAYAILYTINPQILNFNLQPVYPFADNTITQATMNPLSGSSLGTYEPGKAMTDEERQYDGAVRSYVQALGYTVNHGPCVNGETSGCTNLNGLPTPAVDGLKALSDYCKASNGGQACGLRITGGTEDGHKTHAVNRPTVDMTSSNQYNNLENFLGIQNPQEGASVTKTFTYGEKTITAKFKFEKKGGNPGGTSTGDHWHVTFTEN